MERVFSFASEDFMHRGGLGVMGCSQLTAEHDVAEGGQMLLAGCMRAEV